MLIKMIQPWERSPLEIEILESHEAEIIGEENNEYMVSYPDSDGTPIEGTIEKEKFENFPHPVRVRTSFGIIVYKKDKVIISKPWPVSKYWNQELRE